MSKSVEQYSDRLRKYRVDKNIIGTPNMLNDLYAIILLFFTVLRYQYLALLYCYPILDFSLLLPIKFLKSDLWFFPLLLSSIIALLSLFKQLFFLYYSLSPLRARKSKNYCFHYECKSKNYIGSNIKKDLWTKVKTYMKIREQELLLS